jgi:hypothetical protein
MITNFNDKILYLKVLNNHELKIWVANLLINNDAGEIYFDQTKDQIIYQLSDIIKSSDEIFQLHFKNIIYYLLIEWTSELNTLLYFKHLLYLVGRFRSAQAIDFLVKIASREIETKESLCRYKGKYATNEDKRKGNDIFNIILKALISISPIQGEAIQLCINIMHYENTGRYAPLCYRALWESQKEYGNIFFPIMVNMRNKFKEYYFSYDIALLRYIENNTIFFFDHLHSSLIPEIRRVCPDNFKYFYNLLEKTDIECPPQHSGKTICYYKGLTAAYREIEISDPYFIRVIADKGITSAKEKLLNS